MTLTLQVLHPPEPHCTCRVAAVQGPRHDAGRELSWLVKAFGGQRPLVAENSVSVERVETLWW